MMISMMRISSLNICVESIKERKLVTRSFLSPVKVARNYTCCPNLSCNPPVCTEYMTVMKRKWRVENVTITKNMTECCPGYTMTSGGVNIFSLSDQPVHAGVCSPVCPGGCGHGSCVGPATCLCHPGYWGEVCEQECQCRGEGGCHGTTGGCQEDQLARNKVQMILLRSCWRIFTLRDKLSVMSCL